MKTIVLRHAGLLRLFPSKFKPLLRIATCFSVMLALLLPERAMAQSNNQLISPVVWLRADSGTVSPSLWSDWRGGKLSAVSAAGAGAARKGVLNFNRTMVFDGVHTTLKVPYNFERLPSLTVIAVYQPADTTERGLLGTEKALARKVMLSTKKSLGPDSIVDRFGSNGVEPVLHTVIQNWSESKEVADSAFIALGSEGSSSLLSPFKGLLAELLVFDRALSFLERVQTETYLALKYGIPLRNTNYVSSAEEVLWNGEDNSGFSGRIAGLGRDDAFGLYQKQAQSTVDTTGLLVMSAGPLASSNKLNPAIINQGDFLLWGDNNALLTDKAGLETNEVLPVLDRKWLMDVTGTTANQIPTEIQLDLSQLPDAALGYWLVVDRSGKGGFDADKLEYVLADSVSADSVAFFRNIKWDTDHSGTDLFSFSRAKNLLAVIDNIAHPLCATPANGSASFAVVGGIAPYKYELRNATTGTYLKWEGASRSSQGDLAGGEYTLQVTDADGSISKRTFTLQTPEVLLVELGEDQQLPIGGEIILDATVSVPDFGTVSYQWSGSKGFSSTDARVRITEPGEYKVTVTNKNGCAFEDKIMINGPYENNFMVYPTVVKSGDSYQIAVSLQEAASVSVRIYDLKGILLQELKGDNMSEYHFRGAPLGRGMYMVVLETPENLSSKKIIVN